MKFAKFMRKVGTTKNEPISWTDLFFPEIGSLNGS
jgi:NitT/TauT family transport system substrate-binding protein